MVNGRHMSIATRLTWINMLVTSAALLLACAGFWTYDYVTFRNGCIRSLSIQSQIVASNSASALLFDDPRSAENTLAALRVSTNIMGARIFTASGQPFAGYSRSHLQNSSLVYTVREPGAEQHWFKDGRLILSRKITFQGKFIGTAVICSDLSQINARLRAYMLICAIILLACLGAALLLSSFARGSIAAPIVKLAGTARKIARERDYTVRIEPVSATEEISDLLESFREMLVQIQARDEELLQAHNELEARVEERTAQLRSANQGLEAFSYSVSHDLRAPLRQISGFANLLTDDYSAQLDTGARRYLGLIQKGAANMGRLIDDLINLGRIGRQELMRKPTNLNELAEITLRDLRAEIEARAIDVRLAPLPLVECDPGLIKQVFANLLANAVKYTRYQERPVIEVGMVEQGGEPAIFVRDNGAGFDQKYEHKLFGVFQRLHRAEDFEGTGVGLATVRRIVENHGGRIWAKGETGKGAAFFFTLRPPARGQQNQPAMKGTIIQ